MSWIDYDALKAKLDALHRISEYHERRAVLERQLAALDQEFRVSDYQIELERLNWVRDLANMPTPARENGGTPPVRMPSTLRDRILEVAPGLPEAFTRFTIAALIEERFPGHGGESIPASSMRNTLRKLVEDEIFEVVAEGNATESTVYRLGLGYTGDETDENVT